MDIAGVTAVAALIGAIIGALTARNLRTLSYRTDREALLRQPVPVRWVLPVAVAATSILAARLALHHPWALLLLSPLVIAGPWLAAVDLDVHRLPDRALRPVGVTSLLAVVVVSVATHRAGVLVLSGLGVRLAGGASPPARGWTHQRRRSCAAVPDMPPSPSWRVRRATISAAVTD